MVLLPLQQLLRFMARAQDLHDDPFRDLRRMHARARREVDIRVCVDGVGLDVVRAGGQEVDELEVRGEFWVGRQRVEGAEDRCVF